MLESEKIKKDLEKIKAKYLAEAEKLKVKWTKAKEKEKKGAAKK
jgi:hypothetical protein